MKISAVVVVLSCLLAPNFASSQAQKASIAGVVLDAGGDPIPNAKVTLGKLGVNLGSFFQLSGFDRETTIAADILESLANQIALEAPIANEDPGAAFRAAALATMPADDIYEFTVSRSGVASVVYKSSPPVMTDARGRFSFDALEPGAYRLTFSATGYVRQDYGERSIGTGGMPLMLAAGQSKADLVMRMVKSGAISGYVRDNSGQAVAGVPVEIFRSSYDKTGQRKNERVSSARTDDLGEYRLYGLIPGRYIVSAGGVETAAGDGYSTPNSIPENYAQTYYPAASNPVSATAIEVQSAADVRNIDFIVSLLPRYRVRGRVVDLRTGRPPQRVSLVLNARDSDEYTLARVRPADLLARIRPNYNSADGSFELQNINAGAYFLAAGVSGANGFVPLNINANIDGVVLAVSVGGSLNARVRVEANGAPSPPLFLNFIHVQLTSLANVPVSMEFEPQPSPTAEDGKFRFDNLRPGDYRVSIAELPKGFYLKEARLGTADVVHTPLHYSVEETAVLDVVLSPNAGAIDGMALDSAGQPTPGAQVVLIPNGDRGRAELYRQVTADSSGRFTIPSVAPGEYTLAAWESLELYGHFDPEMIRQAEREGKSVRVEESSMVKMDVKKF